MTNPLVVGLQVTSGTFIARECVTAIHNGETAEPEGKGSVVNTRLYH
jgi:hypothetical protein